MLESLVTWVLNNYVGDYLENLNTDQLSIALLSGQVELENVPLKTTALRKLDLPLTVKSGVLGKLTLSVPVTRVRSEPWTLRLSDVLILLGPENRTKYDAEVEESADKARKQAQLDELERLHYSELASAMGLEVSTGEDNSWWGASLLSTVLNNIHLIVTNVHIRYEDSTSIEGHSLCAGVRIQKVVVQTTNHRWKPGFVEPQEGTNVFKKLELKEFSFYWNSGGKMSQGIDSVKDVQRLLSPENVGANAYVVAPCCLELRMEKNSSKLPLKDNVPRFKFLLRPELIAIELSAVQMREMRALTREWARFERARSHRKWRPTVEVNGNAKEWWNFASSRVIAEGRLDSFRRTWSFSLSRARHLNVYARAYKRRLLSLVHNAIPPSNVGNEEKEGTTKPSEEDKTVMRQIERDAQYSFNELSIIRDVVFARLVRENRIESVEKEGEGEQFETISTDEFPQNGIAQEDQPVAGGGLYAWMTSFFSTAVEETDNDDKLRYEFGPVDLGELRRELPKELREMEKQVDKEILEVLHDSWDDSTLLRKDFLLADISMRIDHITLRLTDSAASSPSRGGGRVLSLDLLGVAAHIEMSPRTHSLSVSASVDDLSVQRLLIAPTTPTAGDMEDQSLMYSLTDSTKILFAMGKATRNEEESDNSPLFRLFYRRRSIKSVRHTIEASFRPLSGMYDQDALYGLASLFADYDITNEDETLEGLEDRRDERRRTIIKTTSHVYASIRFPSIKMELRKAGDGLLPARNGEESRAIATMGVDGMELVIESKEEHLTEVRLTIGHVVLCDDMEGTSYPLLSTGEDNLETYATSLSSSWPQLHGMGREVDGDSPLSSSLPGDAPFHTARVSPEKDVRKTSGGGAIAPWEGTHGVSVSCALVGDSHPLFNTKYDKKHVVVDVSVPRVEVAMNRRTWTGLMDMGGMLGGDEKEEGEGKEDNRTKSTKGESRISATLRMHTLSVHMDYPSAETRLGSLIFEDMQVLTKLRDGEESREALRVDASFSSLKIVDRSPSYSLLYDQRLILKGEQRTRLRIIKYANGYRDECDMRVGMETGDIGQVIYTHTHRYLCALMDFWCQLAELQDLVSKSKQRTVEETGDRARVLLDFRIPCRVDVVLPRAHDSEKCLVLTANGIAIKNSLQRASQLANLLDELCLEREGEEGVDCLLDHNIVSLYQVRLREAERVENTIKNRCHPNVLDFSSYGIRVTEDEVFSVPLDISVTALRNLSNEESHAIPDQSFLLTMRCFQWAMSSRFFYLLRGFLELNLGEPLIPIPETIPLELLNKPIVSCEVGSDRRYATLSVRLLLEEVVAECCVGIGGVEAGLSAPLCTIHFVQARLSFDVSTDGQTEIDLICEKASIIDRREGGSREEYGPVLAPLDEHSSKLMGEAHLMMKKDESPVLTVVLVNARILVLPDFLNDVKDFILISPHQNTFIVPDSARCLSSGVIGRAASLVAPPPGPPNSIKVTIRDSELFFLESPFSHSSLALVAKTCTVLQMTEHGGNINATLEIPSMSLGWCTLADETRRSVFSNEFSATLGVVMARDLSHSRRGLPLLIQPRLMLQAQLDGLICKFSHHDLGALRDISAGYSMFISGQQRTLFTKPPDAGMTLGNVSLKCEQAHIWLQDELNGASLPLFRLSLYDVRVDRERDRMRAALCVSVDYFNQQLFGWEPLVEKWQVLQLAMTTKEQHTTVEMNAESRSTLDITMSEQLISQALALQQRLPAITESIERKVYRQGGGVGGAVHHMAYVLKNSTEANLTFTTAVDEILSARAESRKNTVRWQSVGPGSSLYFEFPTKLLFYSAAEREPPRQLIVRVKGWDESSPVNVDASGTFFRVVKAIESNLSNARIVIRVSMERDGRKQIEVCSSVRVFNQLPHPVQLFEAGTDRVLAEVEASSRVFIPLRDTHLAFDILPRPGEKETLLHARARIRSSEVKQPGQVIDSTVCLSKERRGRDAYWLCTSTRRECYPSQDSLPGHSIRLLPPLTVQSLLPVDAQLSIAGHTHILRAGKMLKLTTVDANSEFPLGVETDRLCTREQLMILPSELTKGEDCRLSFKLTDEEGRQLWLFVHARKGMGGAVSLSLWTPFWVLNKSGVSLVIRQDAAPVDAAGQGEEHERASDRHALMFDLAEEAYPARCCIRLGTQAVREQGYRPVFCRGIDLSNGVQALKLQLIHESKPTLYYNIGVEVRPGAGLYKDTQVVLLTSRYVLNNASSHLIYACHYDLLDKPSRHVSIASQCTLVWHENHSTLSALCLKRCDAAHWSCPLRIDTVHSSHVTMRAADESPLFVRVEVTLHGAVFHVTLTDAHFYPPPIQIDNQSEVPVLYQQLSSHPQRSHLRTICKAKSTVDYAWDDASDAHQLVLQVFEKKSQTVDPSRPGHAASLTYDNAFFIALVHSFDSSSRSTRLSERSELVLEVLQKGKVVLNKQNRVDGNSGAQLWRWTTTGGLENVGQSMRHRGRQVLDAIEGGRLMVTQEEQGRHRTQRWLVREDGRVVGEGGKKAIVAHTQALEVMLEEVNDHNSDQKWRVDRLRPGSGMLHVHCTHNGPTMVVRITDREDGMDTSRPSLQTLSGPPPTTLELTLRLRAGIGLSVVSCAQVELIYCRLSGVEVYTKKVGDGVQVTASIEHIQVDNQLFTAEHSLVLVCRPECLMAEGAPSFLPPSMASRPALKMEMNCTPRTHFDSFDVFRIRLCPLSLHLDELLLWKILHLINSSRSANDMHLFTSPPDTSLTRPDALNSRRCYFGNLDLQFGAAHLSVVTVSRNSLPAELRALKAQYNMKLISFENAGVELSPFRQLHYFETSSFLIESLAKFYLAEIRRQTINIVMSLDAFGNPQGFVSDLKDSFAGLFIEGDVQRFLTGIGYGFSNSVSKIASSMSSGVGAITFDQDHEERRMRRSTTSDSALSHLYGGVKGLGVGVLGGVTAIFSNAVQESKKSGIFKGTLIGIGTGAIDTVTKPVQGLCDLVEGTASAIKHVASPAGRRMQDEERLRPPRVCRGLFGLMPAYSESMGKAQLELLRINGHGRNEKLLDVQVCMEQVGERLVRHYVLLSSAQAYVCVQEDDLSSVSNRLPYAMIRSVQPRPELARSLVVPIEVVVESEGGKEQKTHIWCSRAEVARRLVEKIQRAKYDYDHVKRSLEEPLDGEDGMEVASF